MWEVPTLKGEHSDGDLGDGHLMLGSCRVGPVVIKMVSGPTSKVTLMKAVDELVWANSQMLGCRGIFTVGLLQPLEFDIAVRGPKTG